MATLTKKTPAARKRISGRRSDKMASSSPEFIHDPLGDFNLKPGATGKKSVSRKSQASHLPAGVKIRTPAPKATAGDLLASLEDGSFDAAAAKGDWAVVERVVKSRASARALRAA